MTPKVYNCHHTVAYGVYIGRPSKWGNRHRGGYCLRCKRQHTRKEAIQMFEADLMANSELLLALPELRGKNLRCWCAPKPCHGDVLLRLANPPATVNKEAL